MTLTPKQLQEIEQAQSQLDAKRAALGITPENTLTAKLKAERRLSAATVEAFEVQPYKYANQWGWKYPVQEGGERWKNANSDKGPKYAWISNAGAVFYHALDLLPAIAEAGGAVWLTTEADVWALREAGIKNALSTFGETIIPDDLGDMFLAMGIGRVMIAPDQDATGKTFAVKVKAALWGSTIELTCYQLPAKLGEGGDIGKAWQAYSEREPFLYWLMRLPQIEVKEPAPTHTTPAPVYFGEDPLSEIKQAITAALGVDRFGADNFSIDNILCRFHDDKHPSASLHRENGLYCHACGDWYTWKQIAAELGIVWPFESTVTLTALPVGIIGMSREARRVFISAGLTNLSRALDVLLDAGRGGEVMTLAEFTASVLPALTVETARVTFKHLRGMNLPTKPRGSFGCVFSFLNSLQHKEGKKVTRNSKRGRAEGRPQARATIPTESQVNQALGIVPSHYYGMTPEVIGNAKQYRAACMADVIRRKPGKHARKQLAEPLGISYPTIKAYCEVAGIIRTQTPPKLKDLTPEDVIALPADHRERRLMLLQKKAQPNVYLLDERGTRHEYTQAGARQAAALGGGKLRRAEYQASDYRPKGEA